MQYITMNQADITALDHDELKVFAVPLGKAEELLYSVGDIVGIREPFKKVTFSIFRCESGKKIPEDHVCGVCYRSDGRYTSECGDVPNNNLYLTMPEYAVRRFMTVTKAEVKPLSSFAEADIQAMKLDYTSTNNPQLLIQGYLPIKNRELLYDWWRKHYKSTLKKCDDPMAIILHLAVAKAPAK